MPAESFYKAVQFLLRDADGIISPYVGEIEIRLDDDLSLFETIETDQNGFIEDGKISSSIAGEKIRFVSTDYTDYLIQHTGADANDAYDRNKMSSFFFRDQFTETTEPKYVDIYLEDTEKSDVRATKIGSVAPGSSFDVPYESAFEKNLRVYAVAQGASVKQGSDEFANISNDVVSIAPTVEPPVETFRYRRNFMFRG